MVVDHPNSSFQNYHTYYIGFHFWHIYTNNHDGIVVTVLLLQDHVYNCAGMCCLCMLSVYEHLCS